jgi:hypothetical protein
MYSSGDIPKTLAELFARMCNAYGREPNEDVFCTWRAAFGDTPVSELWEAFIAHLRNTTLDDRDGRPFGRWFPTPADLLVQIEAKRRSDDAKRPPRQYCGREDCVQGWIPGEPTERGDRTVMHCPHCKALWEAGGRNPRASGLNQA